MYISGCAEKFIRTFRSPTFTEGERGVKSAKFDLNLQHQSPAKRCNFETKQHIGNLKQSARVQMTALIIGSEILPTLPLVIQGVPNKKCKIWPLWCSGFETKQHIGCLYKLRENLWWPYKLPKFSLFGQLITRTINFHKSTPKMTQPWVVRFYGMW